MQPLHIPFHRPPGLTRKPGFTLIEWVVVISIIVTLAGLLLPALSRGRRQAQAIAFVNNLRQLGMANWMYFADQGMPVRFAWDNWPYVWMLTSQTRYAVVDKVSICPTAPGRSPAELQKDSSPYGTLRRAWLVTERNNYQASYGVNGYFY